MSHSFVRNCCWITLAASFTSSRMKDLCQKWTIKLIFRGVWNSLMAWPDWPWPPCVTTGLRYCCGGTSRNPPRDHWFSLMGLTNFDNVPADENIFHSFAGASSSASHPADAIAWGSSTASYLIIHARCSRIACTKRNFNGKGARGKSRPSTFWEAVWTASLFDTTTSKTWLVQVQVQVQVQVHTQIQIWI